MLGLSDSLLLSDRASPANGALIITGIKSGPVNVVAEARGDWSDPPWLTATLA